METISPTSTQLSRFWAKVEKTETCWLWSAWLDGHGYGRVRFNGKPTPAHRLSYLIHVGEVPDGFMIDHICHNRRCVNPDHLRTVTNKQNGENRNGPQSNNKTGVLGVCTTRSGKFAGRIRHQGKAIHCGTYLTVALAEAAVIAKRIELFTHNDMDRVPA